MRKILIIILLACSLVAEADKWYIATAANGGSDTDGDGSAAHPWLTLKHAADTITGAGFAGDTIVVGAGTFTEPTMVVLSAGVSIYGAGPTSIITTGAALDPIILARSTSQGVNGNQTISYIRFDGNATTAKRAIDVNARSNVQIHHCSFVNFLDNAVRMTGQTIGYSGEPTTYATGNRFYSNSITDCAKDTYSAPHYNATGGLEIAGQSGMLIYDNYISGGARYGYGIQGVTLGGYFKGLKIYDNTIITNNRFTTGAYDFAIELWSQRGGVEIYRNRLWGALDFGGSDTNDEGGYGYAARVFDNDIGRDALPPGGDINASGINIELGHHGGLYIYRNRIHHVLKAIDCQTTSADIDPGQEDIYIYYNLFYNLGSTSGAYSGKVLTFNAEGAYTSTWDDIYFVNNVVYNPTRTGRTIMDCEDSGNTFTNIVFRNNICQGFYNAVKWDHGTVDGLSIENNLTYLVNNLHNLTGVSNDVIQNNVLATDPEFVKPGSDFRLQSTSDAINAGIDVSAITGGTDFLGASLYGAAYDIGAFEYQGRVLLIIDDKIATINYKIPLIEH